jgi:hypothetical protein
MTDAFRTVSWDDSGRGAAPGLTLEDARGLALAAGFAFPSSEGLPPARRANLGAMFDAVGVTNLSAFRERFARCALAPGGVRGAAVAAAGSGPPTNPSLALASNPDATTTTTAPPRAWVACLGADLSSGEHYAGGEARGARDGVGVLLSHNAAGRAELYVGAFERGQRAGLSVVATPRGEGYAGGFLEGLMYGPGEYLFAPPPPEAGAAGAAGAGGQGQNGDANAGATKRVWRVAHRGLFNGRPAGRGVLEYSDGSTQCGDWDGAALAGPADAGACAAAAALGAARAREARAAAAAALRELAVHGLGEAAAALAAEAAPAGAAAGAQLILRDDL